MRSYFFLLVSAPVYSQIFFAPSNALQDGWLIRSRLSTCRGRINSDSMNILGVSCYYHDAAAALLQDSQLIAAAEEERFSRVKHGSSFLRRPGAASPSIGDLESKATATLDNYETNLRLVRILGEADGFRVFWFWQPAFVYGHKPLAPFETRIADNEVAKNTFRVLTTVYEQAERRAAMDGTFAFLGGIFDSVKEPVYIDKWMHLSPTGNELVARSLAKVVEDGLKPGSSPSKLRGQPESRSKRLPISPESISLASYF